MSSSPSFLSQDPASDDQTTLGPDVLALQSVMQNILRPIIGDMTTKTSQKRGQPADLEDQENDDTSVSTKSYAAFGRMLSRCIDPFTTPDAVVNFGIRHEAQDIDSGDEHPLTTKDRRLLEFWETLCSMIPEFRVTMLGLSKMRKIRKKACQDIFDGMLRVRSDDRGSIKDGILPYLLLNRDDPVIPPIKEHDKHKTGRGLHHPVTASLLCPMKYPATSDTFAAIRAMTLPMTASLYPRFLYPEGHIYNPDDIEDGILRGHLLTRIAKHIFQGPSTAMEPPGTHRGKQGNAALSGLSSMTPRTIAYVAVQIRFALSSSASWATVDGSFNYEEFYWRIVAVFDDEDEGPKLIKYFNHHVFGTEEGVAASEQPSFSEEDDYEILQRQRAAKKARRNAPTLS